MSKGSVKRGLPSRFEAGEVARQTSITSPAYQRSLGFVLLLRRGHNHYSNPQWEATYLRESVQWGRPPHTVKESMLRKVVWTFTGYVDKPSELL